LEFLATASPTSNSDDETAMDPTPTGTEETKQMEMPPTASDIALCPKVKTEYATGTAGVKAIRTTNVSPITYRACYYAKNCQYRIRRFPSIADAAAAIECADAWVHDGPHDGQAQMLSDDLVSPFLFGDSNRTGTKLNQNHCTGKGGHYYEVENLESHSPSGRPMRGYKMPQVQPARASACEPSESVGSCRETHIMSLIIIHNGQVALTRTKAKKFWLPCYVILPQRTAQYVARRAATRIGLRIRTGTSQAIQGAQWNKCRLSSSDDTLDAGKAM
jgi:hypothetical protein